MIDTIFNGLINTDCSTLSETPCDFRAQIGRTVFHSHANALGTARMLNRRAGRKVTKVKVIESHFHLVGQTDQTI